jgi:tetratricopeptide (TPR) repeat protein
VKTAVNWVFDENDPGQYRRQLETAVVSLAGQIAAGEEDLEAAWTAVFERLANLYFAGDTPALLQLVDDSAALPLRTREACQARQYFQGVAAFRHDRYKLALATFDDLLAQSPLDAYRRARTLNARAVIYRLSGRLEEAMAGYQASLALWQELGDNHFQGIVHLNLGIIAYSLRRYEEAETQLRQAERFFSEAGSSAWLRKVQSELGLLQRDLGQWDAALAYFDAYIAQSQAAGAEEDVGTGMANRGEVLLFKGDLAGAKEALQTALRLLVSRAYRVDHLLHLGLACQAEGEAAAALDYFRQALILAQEIERREILPQVYYHLGDALRRQGEAEAALAYWAQAVALIEESRTPMREETLKISLLGRWQQVYEALVLHCLALGRPAEAFTWAERARARAFAEGIETGEGGDGAATAAGSAAEIQAALSPDTLLLCYFTTGVLEQDVPLLRAIPAGNPLRRFLLLPARTLLFVVTRDSLAAYECPLDPNLFATSLPRGFAAQRFLQPAVLQHLRHDLLDVWRGPDTARAAARRRLVIVPHGPLHRAPFTALLHPPAGEVQAGEPASTIYAPSGTMYARRPARGSAEGAGCLAVGYNGMRHGRYLEYTELEVERVAAVMGGGAWTGREAKKERLRRSAATCRWLHIACHGYFDEADPLASYLETGEGERLTAREVQQSWRLQARLVTLSACETGVSQILRGDEPMGLVRAFLHAGARAVLVTQWPVDDLATYLLMDRFYGLLQEDDNADMGAVLRRAQRWLQQLTIADAGTLLRPSREGLAALWAAQAPGATPYRAPEFWAGFILVTHGD